METYFMMANIATDLANTAKGTAETFGLNLPHFIAQCISFSIVALILHKAAYQPILKVLEARRKEISDSLDNAEKIKTELAEAEESRKAIIEKANAEANQLIEEARAAAQKISDSANQKAVKEAEAIIANARANTEAEREKMMADMKGEIGRLVVATAGAVIGKVLSADDKAKLVAETNKSIK